MKVTKFLAPILLESPLMFEIPENIRDRYSIDKLDPATSSGLAATSPKCAYSLIDF